GRRTRGDHQGELLDRAGAVFLPDLQHSGNCHLRRAQPLFSQTALWAGAFARHRRHPGASFHLFPPGWFPKTNRPLRSQRTFFSLVVIYLMNLLLLSVMLILASGQITFESFGADLLTNLGNFVTWVVDLISQLQG